MVPGALGGDLGTTLAPRRPKAQKTSQKVTSWPLHRRGQVGSQNRRKKRSGGMLCRFFDVVFGRPVFSSILGDFRLRNWCLFGVVDMAKV